MDGTPPCHCLVRSRRQPTYLIFREPIFFIRLFVELLLEPVLGPWVVAYGQLLALGRTLCRSSCRVFEGVSDLRTDVTCGRACACVRPAEGVSFISLDHE